MTEHTPGPWTLSDRSPRKVVSAFQGHTNAKRFVPLDIATTALQPDDGITKRTPAENDAMQATAEANALLIASGPDLLAALQRLQQSYYPLTRRKSESRLNASLRWLDGQDKANDAARAAIAKATGESQ